MPAVLAMGVRPASCVHPSPLRNPKLPFAAASSIQLFLHHVVVQSTLAPCAQPLARVLRMRATIKLAALAREHCRHAYAGDVPVEPQDFGKNENEHHADEDSRLAHEGAHALLRLASARRSVWRLHPQHLPRFRWRSLQRGPTDQQTGRRPCA